MKRIALALLLSAAVLPALAADNAVIVTPGAGVTMRSRDTTGAGGPQSMITILGDTAGTPSGVFSTYGTSPGAVTVPSMNSFVTNTIAATIASGTITANQGGTWTVQPGNTANTTAWLVTGTGGTFPTTAAATSYADGWSVTAGTKADAVCATPTATACSEIAMLKFIAAGVIGPLGTQPVTVPIGGVGVIASASGGSNITAGNNIAANNTTAVVVKGAAGTVYGVQLGGIGSAPAYLKLYNATSATCGTGTPVKRLIIPAAATAANGSGSNISFGPQGLNFSTGITYCVTTGITDADTTAPAASTFLVNIDWQ